MNWLVNVDLWRANKQLFVEEPPYMQTDLTAENHLMRKTPVTHGNFKSF